MFLLENVSLQRQYVKPYLPQALKSTVPSRCSWQQCCTTEVTIDEGLDEQTYGSPSCIVSDDPTTPELTIAAV